LRGFESDAERSQREDGHEEHLSGVLLQEVTQLIQVILQSRSEPDRRPLTFRLSLKKKKKLASCFCALCIVQKFYDCRSTMRLLSRIFARCNLHEMRTSVVRRQLYVRIRSKNCLLKFTFNETIAHYSIGPASRMKSTFRVTDFGATCIRE